MDVEQIETFEGLSFAKDLNIVKVEVMAFDIGTKHLACCSITKDKNLNFDMFDITAKKPLDRIKNLNNVLKSLPVSCVKLVVIEQQVATNTIAMTIQAAIAIFYISQGIEVEFYNPKEKFKIDNLKNFKNKEHKKIAISYARNILTHLEQKKNLLKFELLDKKDDVADCICMALFKFVKDVEEIKTLIHN